MPDIRQIYILLEILFLKFPLVKYLYICFFSCRTQLCVDYNALTRQSFLLDFLKKHSNVLDSSPFPPST